MVGMGIHIPYEMVSPTKCFPTCLKPPITKAFPAMGSCGLKSAILRPEKPAGDVWRSECHRWWKAGTIILWPLYLA